MLARRSGVGDWDVARFDRWSGRYDRSIFQPLFFRKVHGWVLGVLSPGAGELVLDVGCGTGRLARRISLAGTKTVGVDAAPGMVLKASGAGGAFAVAQAEHLPFADASFDAGVTAVSAHHWHDAAEGFDELRRVIRPGGRLVVADIGSLGPIFGLLKRAGRVDPGHHPGWQRRELADHLYRSGFERVKSRSSSLPGFDVVIVSAERP